VVCIEWLFLALLGYPFFCIGETIHSCGTCINDMANPIFNACFSHIFCALNIYSVKLPPFSPVPGEGSIMKNSIHVPACPVNAFIVCNIPIFCFHTIHFKIFSPGENNNVITIL